MDLKGLGPPKGYTRTNAPCSGIAQAAIPGQKKEYTSDWAADSFLRLALSIGFIEYDSDKDTCFLSPSGKKYVSHLENKKLLYIDLAYALMSYPPVSRILNLIDEKGLLTKFELGSELGFIGEAGFTSMSSELMIDALSISNQDQKNKIIQNSEGTSDKYVRTICGWLKKMKWVKQETKSFKNGEYVVPFSQSYKITLEGKRWKTISCGGSRHSKISKIVFFDMLATKALDRDVLRLRRYKILRQLYRGRASIVKIKEYLETEKITASLDTIKDDLQGLKRVGFNIIKSGEEYSLKDELIFKNVVDVEVVTCDEEVTLAALKEKLRSYLKSVDHKYLALIDLGFSGPRGNREYEFVTAELLTKELSFGGKRLGDSRKPDVCVYYNTNGLILDNKSYKAGFSLSMPQADEMKRYLEENKKRDPNLNANKWWEIFPDDVKQFNFGFVSGSFVGGFTSRLENISLSTGVRGAGISSASLLVLAEDLKSGSRQYSDCFELFDENDEIVMDF